MTPIRLHNLRLQAHRHVRAPLTFLAAALSVIILFFFLFSGLTSGSSYPPRAAFAFWLAWPVFVYLGLLILQHIDMLVFRWPYWVEWG